MKRLCLALILNAMCAPHVCVAVSPGHLDPTFGDGGKRLVPVHLYPGLISSINTTATATTEDGTLYMAGTALNENNEYVMTLTRLDANGDVDHTFGNQGIATHLPQNTGFFTVKDIALDEQGRLVVAGRAQVDGQGRAIACRFDAEGVPDLTFGTQAIPGCYALPGSSSSAQAVLVQHGTGRVILAGSTISNVVTIGLVVGLLPDGSGPDGSFGTAFGLQFIESLLDTEHTFHGIAQDSGGELVAAGSVVPEGFPQDLDFLAFRLDPDGEADPAFGYRTTVFDLSFTDRVDEATSVALLEDGRVVLAGFAQTGPVSYRPAIARYLPDGNLDDSLDFGGLEDGTAYYDLCEPVCDMRAHDLTVLPDGKIVLGGTIADGAEGDDEFTLRGRSDFFALRVLPSGQPDPTFRSLGSPHAGLSIVAFDQLPPQSWDAVFSVATHGDSLLLAGFAQTAEEKTFDLAVARIGNRSPMFQDGFEDPLDP